jgi:hypothetical protein
MTAPGAGVRTYVGTSAGQWTVAAALLVVFVVLA